MRIPAPLLASISAFVVLSAGPAIAACGAITGVTGADNLALSFNDARIVKAGTISAGAGQLVYDSTAKALKYCNGDMWITLNNSQNTAAAGSVTGAIQMRGSTGEIQAFESTYFTDTGLYIYHGGNSYFGWGSMPYASLPTNDLDRSRPNPSGLTALYRINAHTGLSLSAHTNYGGIRFYIQSGASNAVENAGYLAATSRMVMSITDGSVGINKNTPAGRLDVNGVISGGFGAYTSGGAQNWNDISNIRAGSSYSLLTGNAANGPGAASYNYFHAFNYNFYHFDGSDSITQLGIPYGAPHYTSGHDGIYIRSRYNGSWGSWRFLPMQAVSDHRIKTDVKPLSGAMDKVLALNPVTYTHTLNNASEDGFIAHELAAAAPYAVNGEKDAVDEAGAPIYQSVNYGRLTPIIVGAIQEMKVGNDDLKARLDALEAAP